MDPKQDEGVVLEEENQGQRAIPTGLENDLILQTIANYLPVKDLKTFRLVNRTWKRASIATMRKSGCQVDTTAGWNCRPHQFFTYLVKTIENSNSTFPCSRFCIRVCPNPVNLYLEYKLLLSVSNFITELSITVRDNYYLAIRESLIFPQLKSIEIVEYHRLQRNELEKMTAYCRVLMENAPSLDTIKFKNFCGSVSVFSSVIAALNNILVWKIKNLYVCGGISDFSLLSLIRSGLKLKTLSVVLKDTHQCLNLPAFLKTQSNSLESLLIADQSHPNIRLTVSFPCLEHVDKLILIFKSNTLFPNLNYVEQFPALKKLSLKTHSHAFDQVLNSAMMSHTGVDRFELKYVDDPCIVRNAVSIFPSQKLDLNEDQNVDFETAVENLEKLRVRSVQDLDYAVDIAILRSMGQWRTKDFDPYQY